ncbi:unnamed protein product, partial [Ectocarpus sp. 12 AP-2014]
PSSFDFAVQSQAFSSRLSPTAAELFAHTTHAAQTCTYYLPCIAHAFCTERCERGGGLHISPISGATRACGGCSVMGTKPHGSFPGQLLCFPLRISENVWHCSLLVLLFRNALGWGAQARRKRPSILVEHGAWNTHTQETLTAN